ncbi:MutS-related protein [Puia sp. P3]|uniref:MutS-related protein n=1 Tax=Puia sp. P3 TaxID=3423952 RepID=UPI003D67F583
MDQSAISRPSEVPVITGFQSILYHGAPPGESALRDQPPDYFVDLNLDQVVDAVTTGKEEYVLKPFFYTPLRNIAHVGYRQAVLRDLENALLVGRIGAFANGMRSIRQRLPNPQNTYYRYQRERFFLEAAEMYCRVVVELGKGLRTLELQSAGLHAFRDFLTGYLSSPAFLLLREEAGALLADLSGIEYGVYTRELQVQVRRPGPEVDYNEEIERLFGKFKREGTRAQLDRSEPREKTDGMNHVEARILEGVATLFPGIFQRLDEFCERHLAFMDERIVRFDREIQFYIAYLDHTGKIKEGGLPFCYPEMSDKDKEIFDAEGFDLALAYKLTKEGQRIVTNDLSFGRQERIIVVTGPNQGGKTTFSRTFGQLHYLAALGLTVPGVRAKLFLFDRLFTHFERAEKAKDLRSKLEDDLVRLHDILTGATSRSVVILNEILSSATLQDAIYLSGKIMERIDQLDALCVWVTFIDEIIWKSGKTVSMVSEMEPGNLAVRTFKVVRKPADGLAYALAIAEKYRVTYHDLQKRLSS